MIRPLLLFAAVFVTTGFIALSYVSKLIGAMYGH